jgi:branched-chain amino acid transport system substrate-binding protein
VGGPLLRLGLAFLSCAAVGAVASSCSLIVNTNADQCKTASDCGDLPSLRTCDQGVCLVVAKPPTCMNDGDCSSYASAVCAGGVCTRTCTMDSECGDLKCNDGKCGGGAQGCSVNADCSTDGTSICRKDTKTCAPLLTAECKTVYPTGPIPDNAFIFGSILPTEGDDANTGIPIENSIKLAINDITTASNGLPPEPGGTGSRPLFFVSCNDNSDADTAVNAAKHLVDDLGVNAIIGAAFSGITIKVATQVTLPKKVMLFSPSATSVAITTLDNSSPRLLWRTSPPDSFQAQALSLYMSDIEAKVRADNNLMASDKIRVAVLFKGDAYGKGLADALSAKLTFNNGASSASDTANYYSEDYGNPDDPGSDPPHYATTVTNAIGKSPHVIFIFGTNESVTDIFEQIEEKWPTAVTYRPRYILSDGGEVNDLWGYSKMTDALRKRVSGTVPGTTGQLFKSFIVSYKGKFGSDPDPNVFGTAGAYDIVYMLSFAAVSQGSKPLTGTNLATGMSSLVPPAQGTVPMISVGSLGDIGTAFSTLQTAAMSGNIASVIDFNGSSGPLNFDLTKGEAPSDIQIWCMPPGGSTPAGAAGFSGYYYDAAANKMTGTLNWDCTP